MKRKVFELEKRSQLASLRERIEKEFEQVVLENKKLNDEKKESYEKFTIINRRSNFTDNISK
jgi:hypothetical protein